MTHQVCTSQKKRSKEFPQLSQTPPMLEVLNLLNLETPRNIRLKKVQFHRSPEAHFLSGNNIEGDIDVKYRIHIYGQVVKNYLRSDIILKNFLKRLTRLGYFKKVDLLHQDKNEELRLLEFEIVMMI